MDMKVEDRVPPWKKELILRRQNKNKTVVDGQQTADLRSVNVGGTNNVKEPNLKQPTFTSRQVLKQQSSVSVQCDLIKNRSNNTKYKMVQENFYNDQELNNDENDDDDTKISDTDLEDLQYGPGIVNKLRNRYMSLALRATNAKARPTLFRMRNATSFEHLLDDDDDDDDSHKSESNRLFESHLNGNSKNVATTANNRYKKSTHGDLKRTRSEEAISTIVNDYDLNNDSRPKRETIHEDMFIFTKEGNGKPWKFKDNENAEISENKLFTNNTNSAGKRYRPLRVQPVMNEREKPPANFVKQTKLLYEKRPEPQPKGEVANKVAAYKSMCQITKKKPTTNLTRQKPILKKYPYVSTTPSPNVMPDLVLSSPITSPTNKISPLESFIKAEVENAIPSIETINKTNKTNTAENSTISNDSSSTTTKIISKETQNNIRKAGNTFTYDFSKSKDQQRKSSVTLQQSKDNQLATSNKNLPKKPQENGAVTKDEIKKLKTNSEQEKSVKNDNSKKSSETQKTTVKNGEVNINNKIDVPKKKINRVQDNQSNTIVFNFTNTKDVPDYIGNDGRTQVQKIEKPKVIKFELFVFN